VFLQRKTSARAGDAEASANACQAGALAMNRFYATMALHGIRLGTSKGIGSPSFRGGLVMKTKAGFYRHGGTNIDFVSAYPHAIVWINASHEVIMSHYSRAQNLGQFGWGGPSTSPTPPFLL